MTTTESSPTVRSVPGWIWMMLGGLFIIVLLGIQVHSCRAEAKLAEDTANCQNTDGEWVKIPTGHYRGDDGKCVVGTPPARREARTNNGLPAVIYVVTPAVLTLDYEFNIESDGQKLLIAYPGQEPILYKGRCQKLPAPKWSGPKIFTAPSGGHVPFRIYPVRPGEIPPPCPAEEK